MRTPKQVVSKVLKEFKEGVPKVSQSRVGYRIAEFETAECGYCRYFLKPAICKVIVGDINAEFVCVAWQGKEKTPLYKVPEVDIADFIKGMEIEQPYQHEVIDGFNTPEGWLIIIRDTMKPKPHTFSLPLEFHILHTSREHSWTQTEVDALIAKGK